MKTRLAIIIAFTALFQACLSGTIDPIPNCNAQEIAKVTAKQWNKEVKAGWTPEHSGYPDR